MRRSSGRRSSWLSSATSWPIRSRGQAMMRAGCRSDEFVVPDRAGVLRFRHDLVRATAYAGLSFQRRRDIHERVGLALERTFGGRADGGGCAALAALPRGRRPRTGLAIRHPGSRPCRGRIRERRRFRALRACARGGSAPRSRAPVLARVEEALGDVCERFGAFERARISLESALERTDTPIDRARLMRKISVTLDRAGHYDEAAESLDTAVALLGDEPASEDVIRTRAAIERAFAGTRYRQARYLEAIDHADRAIELAETDGQSRGGGPCVLYRGHLVRRPRTS